MSADDALLLQVSADVSKLEKQMAKALAALDGASDGMEKRAKKAAHNIEASFAGINVGEALEKTFARARLGVLEEGAAKIGIFGAALESLGPVGIIAGTALTAAGVAFEQVRKAMENADEIDRVSKSLGISTTALQEFDSAAISMSVGQDKAREALGQFNEVFNKYASGLASAKQAKFLDALGFTPESARHVTDIGSAVELTLKKLAAFPNQGQRASLASQLGLSNFNVVLGEGADGVDRFIAKMREAQESGEVISPEQIARAAELNDEVEHLQYKIGQELKGAFIDAAPAIESVARLIERLVHGTAQFVHNAPDFAVGLQDVEKRAAERLAGGGDQKAATPYRLPPAGFGPGPLPIFLNLAKLGVASLSAHGHEIRAQEDAHKAKPEAPPPTDRRVVDLSRFNAPHGGVSHASDDAEAAARKALQRQKASADAAFQAQTEALQQQQAELQARAALAGSVEARAAIEDDLGKLATQDKQVQLAKRLSDASYQRKLGTIDAAAEAQVKTEVAKAVASTAIVASLEKELRTREAARAIAERDLQDRQTAAALSDRVAAAREPGLTSNRARAELALDLLQRRQAEDEDAASTADRNDPRFTDAQRADRAAARQEAAAAEMAAERQRQQRQTSPLYDLAHPATAVTDDLEAAAAKGLGSLSDGLTEVLTGTKDVKAAFTDMAQSIIADLVRIGVEREIVQPLAGALFGAGGSGGAAGGAGALGGLVGALSGAIGKLPHFASGTDFAPGGLSLVGERGPELVNIPAGAGVLTNNALRGLSNLRPEDLGRGGGPIALTVNVDAGGAFSFDHVTAAVQVGVQQAAQHSGVQLARAQVRQARRARYSRPLG